MTKTCDGLGDTQTISANGNAGATADWTVPSCAQTLRFTVIGGNGALGGSGALIEGTVPVSGGEALTGVAGGSGGGDANGNAGTSRDFSGGTAYDGGFGGGAGSGLELNGDWVAVAGGGGGGAVIGASDNGPDTIDSYYEGDGQSSNAGQTGGGLRAYWNGNYLSSVTGGSPGTDTAPGQGGTWDGSQVAAANGNAANGRIGADGIPAPQKVGDVGGSGGGGGG